MAIAFDNAAVGTGSLVNSINWLHTAAGANTFMLTSVATGATISVSGVAVAGAAMTFKGQANTTGATVWLWTRAGHAGGTLSMSAILVGATTGTFIAGSVSYTGVSQATPDGTVGSATAAASMNANLSIATAAGQTVFGAVAGTVQQYTVPATQTSRFDVSATGLAMNGSEKASGGTTTSMSWSSGSTLVHCMIGEGFSATAIAAGTLPPLRNLLGVGK